MVGRYFNCPTHLSRNERARSVADSVLGDAEDRLASAGSGVDQPGNPLPAFRLAQIDAELALWPTMCRHGRWDPRERIGLRMDYS